MGNADLSIPVNRVNLDPSVVNARRPFPAHGPIYTSDYEGPSRYDSLQVTLSRQTGKRLQYFAAYTLEQGTGHVERRLWRPRSVRSVADLRRARRRPPAHLQRVVERAAAGREPRPLNSAFGRAVLDGWQLSGISTFTSGVPIHLSFSGDAAGRGVSQAYFGTPDVVGPAGPSNGLAPAFTCDPRRGGSRVGETLLDVDCIKVPDFGTNPSLVPPYDIRTPSRMTHDLTRVQELRAARLAEAAVPRRLLQHLQHRLRGDRDRQRRGSDARHEVQPPRGSRAERRRRLRRWRVRSRRRVFVHGRHESELREDQHPAWSPGHRVRAEVLLLAGSPVSVRDMTVPDAFWIGASHQVEPPLNRVSKPSLA